MSGIRLDLIFRGHLGPVVGVSKDLIEINKTGVVNTINDVQVHYTFQRYSEFHSICSE
jgi:hypothetical protein